MIPSTYFCDKSCYSKALVTKVEFFLETRQKNLSPMAGIINLNFHLPTPANDAKIQIQFSRHWTKDFFGGFLR